MLGDMKPWEHLDSAATPDGQSLELWRHDADYAIRADGYDLMVSRAHQSEDVMMSLACPQPPAQACVLVGGLGMGYTLRATLDLLRADGAVVVSELIPEVVEWNRGPLGPLADHPLDDPRTRVDGRDVEEVIRESTNRFERDPARRRQRPGRLHAGGERATVQRGWACGGPPSAAAARRARSVVGEYGAELRAAVAASGVQAFDAPGEGARAARGIACGVRGPEERGLLSNGANRSSHAQTGSCVTSNPRWSSIAATSRKLSA